MATLLGPLLSSTETAPDKVENESRGKEKEIESGGEDGQDEDEGEEEEEEDEEDLDEEEDQEDGEEDVLVVGEESAQDGKEDGKRATSRETSGAPAAKKSKPSTLSTEEQAFVTKFMPTVPKIADKQHKISVRWVKGNFGSRQRNMVQK